MSMLRHMSSRATWTTPAFALRRLIPAGYGVFLAGFVISGALFSAGRKLRLDNGVMSDLLSRIDNPRGYLFSTIATVACGVLLLPTATIFQRGWRSAWAVLGAWFYRVGLIVTIAIGATTPFQQPYIPIHIWLAFLALMSLAAGLALCLVIAACSNAPARFLLAALGAFQMSALIFLAYVFLSGLFFGADFFAGRRWLLPVCEWALNALTAVSTVALTAILARGSNPPGDFEGRIGPPNKTLQATAAALRR